MIWEIFKLMLIRLLGKALRVKNLTLNVFTHAPNSDAYHQLQTDGILFQAVFF